MQGDSRLVIEKRGLPVGVIQFDLFSSKASCFVGGFQFLISKMNNLIPKPLTLKSKSLKVDLKSDPKNKIHKLFTKTLIPYLGQEF